MCVRVRGITESLISGNRIGREQGCEQESWEGGGGGGGKKATQELKDKKRDRLRVRRD